jgi:hypothetical protein
LAEVIDWVEVRRSVSLKREQRFSLKTCAELGSAESWAPAQALGFVDGIVDGWGESRADRPAFRRAGLKTTHFH